MYIAYRCVPIYYSIIPTLLSSFKDVRIYCCWNSLIIKIDKIRVKSVHLDRGP